MNELELIFDKSSALAIVIASRNESLRKKRKFVYFDVKLNRNCPQLTELAESCC